MVAELGNVLILLNVCTAPMLQGGVVPILILNYCVSTYVLNDLHTHCPIVKLVHGLIDRWVVSREQRSHPFYTISFSQSTGRVQVTYTYLTGHELVPLTLDYTAVLSDFDTLSGCLLNMEYLHSKGYKNNIFRDFFIVVPFNSHSKSSTRGTEHSLDGLSARQMPTPLPKPTIFHRVSAFSVQRSANRY